MAGNLANFGGKKAAPFGKKGKSPVKKTASELRSQAKAMVKENMNAGNGKNDSDTRKLPPKQSKKVRKSESLNFAKGVGREISLSYEGFAKLKGQLAAKGATDPAGLAAAIGRRKYGAKKFGKAAAKGVPLGKKGK